MIYAVNFDGKEPVRTLAGEIRTALTKRLIVFISNFSSNQATLMELANQLGTARVMHGTPGSSPVVGANLNASASEVWFRSNRTEYQRLAGAQPVISLDYCATPSHMIRWFTDMTDLVSRYPKGMFDGLEKATATYRLHQRTRTAPLFRATRIGGKPYIAITDKLESVEGASPELVAEMKAAMINLYGFGTNEVYVDRPSELVIHISDGIATGRMPGPEPRQGQFSHLTVTPNWNLMLPT